MEYACCKLSEKKRKSHHLNEKEIKNLSPKTVPRVPRKVCYSQQEGTWEFKIETIRFKRTTVFKKVKSEAKTKYKNDNKSQQSGH